MKTSLEMTMRRLALGVVLMFACASAVAAAAALGDEATVARLRDDLRIDTSNPPRNEIPAAEFCRDWLATEGQGAPRANRIPTLAEARLDVRLLAGQDPDAFLGEVRRVVHETGVTVEMLGTYRAATASPMDSDLMRAIDRVRARLHPKAVLAPTVLTGWTGSAALRTLGIKAYGFEPYVPDPAEQDRQHGNDERISVENMHRGARILEEIVRDVAC